MLWCCGRLIRLWLGLLLGRVRRIIRRAGKEIFDEFAYLWCLVG